MPWPARLPVVKAVAGDETASHVETTLNTLRATGMSAEQIATVAPLLAKAEAPPCMRMPRRKAVRTSSPGSRPRIGSPLLPRRGRFPRQPRKARCWRTPNVAPK